MHAHCDLPCGVYDPAQARIEAESVKVICQKYAGNDDEAFRTRAILIKEQRSELVKHHLWVLWTDYFKPPHFEKYPELHGLFNEATKLAGAAAAPRASSTAMKRRNCSTRSPRSTRSSGRPSRPESHRLSPVDRLASAFPAARPVHCAFRVSQPRSRSATMYSAISSTVSSFCSATVLSNVNAS